MRCSATELLSACASVLATMKSTPSISAWIMLATALPPAPPTPMTAIRGRSSSTEGGPMLMLIPCSPWGGFDNHACGACATKRITRAKGKSNYPQCRKRSEVFLHRQPQAPEHQPQAGQAMDLLEARADRADVDRVLRGIEHEPGEGREAGNAVRFGKALELRRPADPDRLAERGLGIVGQPGKLCAAAREHHLAPLPARIAARIALRFERAADVADEPVELAGDHADQLGARDAVLVVGAACDRAGPLVARAADRDQLAVVGRAGDRRAVDALEPLRLEAADAEGAGDRVGDVGRAARDRRQPDEHAAHVDRDVGYLRAELDQRDAEVALLGCQA